jgi:CBS domain-containing protein
MEEWIEDDLTLLSKDVAPLRVLDQRVLREPIRHLNPRAPLSLPPSATVLQAIRLMREHRIGCILVVEENRLAGIMTERDLLLKLEQGGLDRPLAALMTSDPEVLHPDDPIVYALNKMSVGGFRHVPLVDAEHHPVGIISVKDIVDYICDFFPNDVLTVPPDPERAETWTGRDGG